MAGFGVFFGWGCWFSVGFFFFFLLSALEEEEDNCFSVHCHSEL